MQLNMLEGRPAVYISTEYQFIVVDSGFNRISLVKNDTVLASIEKGSLSKYYKNSYENWYCSVRKKNLAMVSRREYDIKVIQDEINKINALYAYDPDRGNNGRSKN